MITIYKMNTVQLNKILKIDKIAKKKFIGTYPIDLLPDKIKYPSCMIINNKPSNEEGEHWVAVYFNKNKTCDFFDSFGNSPKYFKLYKYLKKYANKIYFNKKKVQSDGSLYCGVYCILFLLFKCRGFGMKNFLNYFKNPIFNDINIKKLLKN